MKNSMYEVVETGDVLPFDVSLHSVNYVPSHWHNSVEIIFVLRGTLEVTANGLRRRLAEGDVLLINDCRVHEVIGLDMNIIATFLIPMAYLKENVRGIEQVQFECDSGSADKERKPALERIRQYLAEMVQLNHKKDELYEMELQVRMISVFSILMKQFKLPDRGKGINEKYMDRLLRIIRYIDDHYKEPITLQAIARQEFLTVPYLSKFFRENIGLNFQSYLTSIRLKHSVEDLLRHEDAPIADIALSHGFPNAKSFYAAFKNKYRITPHEYRKQYHPAPDRDKKKFSSNYFEFNQSSALGIINQYLQRGRSYQASEVYALETESCEIKVLTGSPIRHTWKVRPGD